MSSSVSIRSSPTVIEHVSPPHADTTPPKVTVLFPWPGARLPFGSHFVPLVLCRDRGVGVQGCEADPLDTRTAGAHVLVARGWDKNGNLTTVKVRYVVMAPPPPRCRCERRCPH